MNERIRELAEHAGFMVDQSGCIMVCFTSNGDSEVKKFAELIVRKCAELSVNSQYANTKSEYYEGFNEALIYVGNKIKRHFGVEEE